MEIPKRETIPWPPLPKHLTLAPEEVVQVRFSLDENPALLADCWPLLSPDERERAESFRLPHLRRRHVLARGGLRQALARCCSRQPEELAFEYANLGKPKLAGDFPGAFNLAHSGDEALLALTGQAVVGVDVEVHRPLRDAAHLAKRYFTPAESAWVLADPAGPAERFFTLWTLKEALLKATGTGLSAPLDSFDVLPAAQGPNDIAAHCVRLPEGVFWLVKLQAGPQSYAAAALSAPIDRVRRFQLSA